ncbi:MAG: sigma-70 family RNA polymerase sigma factor [Bacteroidota bacterium]
MSEKEEQLFNEVFLQYYPILFHFGKRIVADDYLVEECIHELFLYIYEKEINLATVNNLRAYLFMAFRRRILLKKTTPQFADLSTIPTDIYFLNNDFVNEDEQQFQKSKQLSKMLNDLPWRQREAVFLKYFNNLSTKEIAEVMGIQPQVVANTIYKALKKMRDIAANPPFISLAFSLLELAG